MNYKAAENTVGNKSSGRNRKGLGRSGRIRKQIKNLSRIKRIKLYKHLTILFVIGVLYIGFAVSYLYSEKLNDDYNISDFQGLDIEQDIEDDELGSQSATDVTVGTYFENIRSVSIRESEFRVQMMVWYKWQDDEELDIANHIRVYKGTINDYAVVEEYHEDGINYQRARMDVTVSTNFNTSRFPFGTYNLEVNIEPDYNTERVVFNAEQADSVSDDLNIEGYEFIRSETGVDYKKYPTSFGLSNNPEDNEYCAYHYTKVEIRQRGMGVYTKCFISLIGAIMWVFLLMYINVYHRIDPMVMIPVALFSVIANISVGESMLPDSLDLGLLEFVNIWGEFTIIAAAIIVIGVNFFRNRCRDTHFARLYGKLMLFELLLITVIGHIAMAVAAYQFLL